MPYLDHII